MDQLELERLEHDLTVCRLSSVSQLDLAGDFYFIGRTDEEISLVCRTEDAPEDALAREDGWKGFRVRGVLEFSLIGILSRLSGVLAENGIGIYAVSTYNTDYILVKKENFEKALAALERAGCRIVNRGRDMTVREAIEARHSVRRYRDEPIPAEVRAELEALLRGCNEESGLHLQLILDDPGCFDSLLAHYGKFRNVRNYIAVVGPKKLEKLEELAGYYGQKAVLAAQMLGLNTCWVGGTFRRGKCRAVRDPGEKLLCVIAIGYGEDQGTPHRSRPLSSLCDVAPEEMPSWFKNGVRGAMLAPTALNQQRFRITLEGDRPVITAGKGVMTGIDLGIVKYSFEAASGRKCL